MTEEQQCSVETLEISYEEDRKVTITIINDKKDYSLIKVKRIVTNYMIDFLLEDNKLTALILMTGPKEIYFIVKPDVTCNEFQSVLSIINNEKAMFYTNDDYEDLEKYFGENKIKKQDEQKFMIDYLPEEFESPEDYLKQQGRKINSFEDDDDDDDADDDDYISENDIKNLCHNVYCSSMAYATFTTNKEHEQKQRKQKRPNIKNNRYNPKYQNTKQRYNKRARIDIKIDIQPKSRNGKNFKSRDNKKEQEHKHEQVRKPMVNDDEILKVMKEQNVKKCIAIQEHDKQGNKITATQVYELMDKLKLSSLQKVHIANQTVYIILVDRFIDLEIMKNSQHRWRLIDEKALDNK